MASFDHRDLDLTNRATRFAGRSIADHDLSRGIVDPDTVAYRVYDAEPLLSDPTIRDLSALVIGHLGIGPPSEAPEEMIAALVTAAPKMPRLTHLFFGDVRDDEAQISWIEQGNMAPLFSAFPNLETLRIRGTSGLSLGQGKRARLRALTIESGGLPNTIIEDIVRSELPELEILELWFGVENYGCTSTMEDVEHLIQSDGLPKLRALGLRNCMFADETAAGVAHAPLMARLEILDLSLGTFGDKGALALLASPHSRRLERIDVRHNYLSSAMEARLGAELNVLGLAEKGDPMRGQDRYVAVTE